MVTLIQQDPTEVTSDVVQIEQAIEQLVRVLLRRDRMTDDVYQALLLILAERY